MAMKKIKEQVAAGSILVSDGAWGTFLYKKGLKSNECPDSWCISHRNEVLEIAQNYIMAGADMIESNSFGANEIKLSHYGMGNQVAAINEAAAAISREAAGANHYVIASVGPTGKMLVNDDIDEKTLYRVFKDQIMALEKGGADAVCIETFADIDEARIAIQAARENTGLEVICTFTFEKTLQAGFRTMMGVSPSQMTSALIEAGADIVGTNCGNGMEPMAAIVAEIRSASASIPILVHANAGKPSLVKGKDVFPESPSQMAASALKVVEAGANIVGGCCGTTPEHITAIAKAVKQHVVERRT
jgi:5-methyltetrahydrofolate--homocysteine methyltransferase